MKILSLFDGMSCGSIALINLGVQIECYDAFEIDKYAIKTSQYNFPFIKHHGDVFKANFKQLAAYRGGYDFLIGGSPCTYWSIAQKNNRETEASGVGWELFSQYVRALHEVKPKFFIYENNKSMSDAIRQSITDTFGFEPICINSQNVSAQNRERLYWCGLLQPDGSYIKACIPQPNNTNSLLINILDSDDFKTLSEKEMEYMAKGTNGRYSDRWTYLIKPGEKDKSCCITANIHKGVPYNVCAYPAQNNSRYKTYKVENQTINVNGMLSTVKIKDGFYVFRKISVKECMRLQTVPEWYQFPVSDTQAYKMLGNGWTVDVISHIINSMIST